MGDKKEQQEPRKSSLEEKRLIVLKKKLASNEKLEKVLDEFCYLHTAFICRGASSLRVDFKALEKLETDE